MQSSRRHAVWFAECCVISRRDVEQLKYSECSSWHATYCGPLASLAGCGSGMRSVASHVAWATQAPLFGCGLVGRGGAPLKLFWSTPWTCQFFLSLMVVLVPLGPFFFRICTPEVALGQTRFAGCVDLIWSAVATTGPAGTDDRTVWRHRKVGGGGR